MVRVLTDDTSQGKPRKWGVRKEQSRQYAKRVYKLADIYYSDVMRKHAGRVWGCGDSLEFKQNKNGQKILIGARFCHDRLCALCQWRRMLKMSYQMTKTIEQSLIDYPNSRFLFLTLTVKNCTGDELHDTVKALNTGLAGMMRRKKVKQDIIGYVKAVEVTVNNDRETFHPHIHVLLQVSSSYFKKQGHYLKHDEWMKLWRRAMKLGYDPSVRISPVKARNGKDSVHASIAELAKYQTKATQFLSLEEDKDLKIIDILRTQLDHTRMLAYTGHLKEIYSKLFKQENEDTEDLVKVDGSWENIDPEAMDIVAVWDEHFHNYVIEETNEPITVGKNQGYK